LDAIELVLLWVMGRPRRPRGAKVATSPANAVKFVSEFVDRIFPHTRYDIRQCGDTVEFARDPISDDLSGKTAIVHFRLVPEIVPGTAIAKLASLKASLDCPGVFVSWLNEYSEDAMAIADNSKIYLYRLNANGECDPCNSIAKDLAKRQAADRLSWIEWLIFAIAVLAAAILYLGPLALFYWERSIREAIGFPAYIRLVTVVGVPCLIALFYLIWGKTRRWAWRWPGGIARSLAAFCLLILNIALVFACAYLSRSEQYPDSFSLPLTSRTQALYFSFTTLTTVGYGDIHPKKDWGRRAVLIELAVTLSIVGVAFAGLGNRLASPETPSIE